MSPIMKTLSSLLLLGMLSCVTNPIPTPVPTPCPICPPKPKPDTIYVPKPYPVHDTVKIPVIVHDTVTIHDTISSVVHDTIAIFTANDTALNQIVLHPLVGDNADQIQNAVNFQLANPGWQVFLAPGAYPISRTIIFANIINGIYKQCTPRFRGCMSAKAAPDGMVSRIIKLFNDGPAFAVQLAKGGYIQDIRIVGNYIPPQNQIQIAILPSSGWDVPGIRSNTTSPECAIAVDPFSDPAFYDGIAHQMYPSLLSFYIPGMSRSGSTGVIFKGISMKNVYVGFIITPSNQQNGEIIHLIESEIEACKTAYAICQAQSKQCEVRDFKCWGPAYTIYDNITYGIQHGDGAGSPMVDGTNFAGFIHQIFYINNYAFQGSFNNIYGEGVFKLGKLGGNAGAKLSNSTIDFANGVYGQPTPDYYFYSENTEYDNCTLRLYAGAVPGMRIILNGDNNMFRMGHQTMPPLWKGVSAQGSPPHIIGLCLLLSNNIINTNDYDTLTWLTVTDVHINQSDWSGWFLRGLANDQRGNFSNIKVGDPVVTDRNLIDIYYHSYNYPVGYVHHISGDTVFLTNVGVGIKDGERLAVYDFGLKN